MYPLFNLVFNNKHLKQNNNKWRGTHCRCLTLRF